MPDVPFSMFAAHLKIQLSICKHHLFMTNNKTLTFLQLHNATRKEHPEGHASSFVNKLHSQRTEIRKPPQGVFRSHGNSKEARLGLVTTKEQDDIPKVLDRPNCAEGSAANPARSILVRLRFS